MSVPITAKEAERLKPLSKKLLKRFLPVVNFRYTHQMKRRNNKCIAFKGQIGEANACSIYKERPINCSKFQVGGEPCNRAREHFSLPPIDEHGNVTV